MQGQAMNRRESHPLAMTPLAIHRKKARALLGRPARPFLPGVLLILLFLLAHLSASCASFGGSVTYEQNSREMLPAATPLHLRVHVEGVQRADDVSALLARLAERGVVEDANAEGLLTITVEGMPSTSGGLKLLNLLATALSGLVIPFYNQVNRSVEIRIYEGQSIRCSSLARTRNHEVVGLVSLPAMPFLWPVSKQSSLYLQSVDDFANRCLTSESRSDKGPPPSPSASPP